MLNLLKYEVKSALLLTLCLFLLFLGTTTNCRAQKRLPRFQIWLFNFVKHQLPSLSERKFQLLTRNILLRWPNETVVSNLVHRALINKYKYYNFYGKLGFSQCHSFTYNWCKISFSCDTFTLSHTDTNKKKKKNSKNYKVDYGSLSVQWWNWLW